MNRENYPNIWIPPVDYILGENKRNYISVLRYKIRSIRDELEYLNTVVNNPNVSKLAKELYFIPQILRSRRALKIYEQQGSLLAA